ncbi:PEPxxWA-CTERM sorting domain-containing protein [Sandaracinobacteroides saxicola]|uniref:PEPxxWA-CTERM sorting domain-containing protein n=1 Tax=Sandaracinobacteroides saxicola TaxID=2759707 RepID=UPI001FB1307C|nr:PEPxxWA-CTERM sorting domain-containing protein [Sandaracinobacteroides saxicola]
MGRTFISSRAALALLLAVATAPATATTLLQGSVLDTGTTGLLSDTALSYSLSGDQWIAGRFVLAAPMRVGGVQGLIQNNGSVGDTLHAVIRLPDAQGLPGAIVHSARFAVTNEYEADWEGPESIRWTLGAGSYWLAFEVHGGDSFTGGMPDTALTPLGNYSFSYAGNYYRYPALNSGMRLLAASAVPEPASWAMMIAGFGLVGLALRRQPSALDAARFLPPNQ